MSKSLPGGNNAPARSPLQMENAGTCKLTMSPLPAVASSPVFTEPTCHSREAPSAAGQSPRCARCPSIPRRVRDTAPGTMSPRRGRDVPRRPGRKHPGKFAGR